MRKAYSYIRMSTKQQLQGDSLRRQMESSKVYAKQHNLELIDNIEGFELQDIGVSAFKGYNATNGSFALFLDLLENDRIEKNSVLLVESLDRLSRDNMTNALTQFLTVIQKGIEIVTLIDNQSYTKERIDQNSSSLFMSLAIMARANDESEVKSKRLKSAWANKRKNVDKKVITKLAPYWIKYSDTKEKFELITERAETVKLIFKLCKDVCGLYSITKYLNENNLPVFGKSKFWNRSYVKKILSNRAVLGEFQPCTMVDGKRVPHGDVINDYYPKVIEEEDFYLAQSAIKNRTINQSGRKGKTFTNLFTGLIYCSACGTKFTLRNRGSTKKGGKYLVCQNKIMGAGCNSVEWKYDLVEKLLLEHLIEIDFEQLINTNSDSVSAENKINELNNLVSELKVKSENIMELLVNGNLNENAKISLINRENQNNLKIIAILNDIDELKKSTYSESEQTNLVINETLKEVVKLLNENPEDYFFRAKLNQLLAKTIKKIDLVSKNTFFIADEISPEDSEVKEFLKLNSKLNNLNFKDLLENNDFKTHVLKGSDTIRITYKSGLERTIFTGMSSSMISKSFEIDATNKKIIRLN